MADLEGTVTVNGVPISGVTVKLYKRSRFGGTDPIYDTPAPASPDATAISGDAGGGAGEWHVPAPTLEDHWEANEYNGHTAWRLHPQALLLDVSDADVQPVGPANSAGPSTQAAPEKHVHEGVHQITVNGGVALKGDVPLTIPAHGVDSVVPGPGIGIDNTDPHNPVATNSGVRSIVAGAGIGVSSASGDVTISNTSGSGGTTAVQHNDALVTAEAAIDFEDSASVMFTVADDAANGRVKVTATAESAATQTVGEFSETDAAVNTAGAGGVVLHDRTIVGAPTGLYLVLCSLYQANTQAGAWAISAGSGGSAPANVGPREGCHNFAGYKSTSRVYHHTGGDLRVQVIGYDEGAAITFGLAGDSRWGRHVSIVQITNG